MQCIALPIQCNALQGGWVQWLQRCNEASANPGKFRQSTALSAKIGKFGPWSAVSADPHERLCKTREAAIRTLGATSAVDPLEHKVGQKDKTCGFFREFCHCGPISRYMPDGATC